MGRRPFSDGPKFPSAEQSKNAETAGPFSDGPEFPFSLYKALIKRCGYPGRWSKKVTFWALPVRAPSFARALTGTSVEPRRGNLERVAVAQALGNFGPSLNGLQPARVRRPQKSLLFGSLERPEVAGRLATVKNFRPLGASETRGSLKPFSDDRKKPSRLRPQRARRNKPDFVKALEAAGKARAATKLLLRQPPRTCGLSLSSTPARRRPTALAVALLASRRRARRARVGQGQQDIARRSKRRKSEKPKRFSFLNPKP